MSGSTSIERAIKLLRNFIKSWGLTIVGAAVSLFLLIFAFNIACVSQGICRQSTMSLSDAKKISAQTTSSNATDTTESIDIISKPVRMLLPSVDLGLDIVNVTIDVGTNNWPLSDGNVQYANFTPGLGSKRGTMFLYGHATWPVLRKTGDLKIGDTLILVDDRGKTWRFKLSKVENVTPDKVGFLYEDVPFRVVISTCDGWGDQYRRLMYFTI